MDLLPEDLLAAVLGRLAPRSLAVSWCVRKHWCAIIDTRRLLRADLLPRRLHSIFCLVDQPDDEIHFFSPRGASADHMEFLEQGIDDYKLDSIIDDHCNGLILLWDRVVNPATRQWVPLPPLPPPGDADGLLPFGRVDVFRFLAYDPMVSPHCYEVVSFPAAPTVSQAAKWGYPTVCEAEAYLEWPPSPLTTYVFSSVKRRWEQRTFLREGGAAGIVADVQFCVELWTLDAVYLRGALYVRLKNNTTVRMALSSNKYRMIIPPNENKVVPNGYYKTVHLGKSKNGVYYSAVWTENRWPHCGVWLLNEEESSEGSRMEWVLKCNISLQALFQKFGFDNSDAVNGPWTVDDRKNEQQHANEEEQVEDDEFEWDFDSGGTIILPEMKDDNLLKRGYALASFLGFHPYKEIAFFLLCSRRVVSYDLNSSRVHGLGILNAFHIGRVFPYTPCKFRI